MTTIIVTRDSTVVELRDDGTWRYLVPDRSALARLRTRPIPPAIAAAVQGMFSQLGVKVIDSGEAFTCRQHGDRVEIVAGVEEASVDFVVHVYQFQLERLAECISRGTLDELELFRVVTTLFGTATGRRHVLRNPLMSSSVLRRMIRGKNLMHVTLVSPDPGEEPDATYTIIFINGEQLVVPGLHGAPLRILRVPLEDAMALQRNFHAGLKGGLAPARWIKIARWYVDWRKRVDVTPR